MTAVILESFLDRPLINQTEEMLRDAHVLGFDEGFIAGQSSARDARKDRLEKLSQAVLEALSEEDLRARDIRHTLSEHIGHVLQHVLGEILPQAIEAGMLTRLREALSSLMADDFETTLVMHPDNLDAFKSLGLHETFKLGYEPSPDLRLHEIRIRHADKEQSLNAEDIRFAFQELLQSHLYMDRTTQHDQ